MLPADKGNATVLLDEADCKIKMLALLNDQSAYVRIKEHPTAKITWLKKLLANVSRVVPPQHKSLFVLQCHNCSAPALYGLPKVHKRNVPVRSIVDFARSRLYNLSGFQHRRFTPLVGRTPTNVCHAADVIGLFMGFNVPKCLRL